MANFSNLSFEDPLPGGLVTLDGVEFQPLNWTITEVALAVEIADQSDTIVRQGTETFERGWAGNEDFVFGFVGFPFDLDVAIFNTPGPNPSIVEDFERLWSGAIEFAFDLSRLEVAVFAIDGGNANVETFESEWANNDFGDFTLDAADFTIDGGTAEFEDFESEWRNTDYKSEFAPADLDAAPFQNPRAYGAAENTEDFEDFEGVTEWLHYVKVETGGSAATWQTVINAENASFKSGSDTANTIAGVLVDRINGLSVGVVAQDSPSLSGVYYMKQATLPPTFEVELNVQEEASDDQHILVPFATLGYWSQAGTLATEV